MFFSENFDLDYGISTDRCIVRQTGKELSTDSVDQYGLYS